jgi:hypothetical protein
MLVVGLAVLKTLHGTGEIPQRDTAECLLALDVADELLECGRGDVAIASSLGACRETDKKLSVLGLVALGDQGCPGIVVEDLEGPGDVVDGVAAGIVVELDEESVVWGLLDKLLHVEVLVASRALRRSSQEQGAIKLTEPLSHADVRRVVELARQLKVEVEAIDLSGCCGIDVERTRASPGSLLGAESRVEPVGKVCALVHRGHEVVAIISVVMTTNAEKNLDALGSTVGNI